MIDEDQPSLTKPKNDISKFLGASKVHSSSGSANRSNNAVLDSKSDTTAHQLSNQPNQRPGRSSEQPSIKRIPPKRKRSSRKETSQGSLEVKTHSKKVAVSKRAAAAGRRRRSYLSTPPTEAVRSAMQLPLRQGTYVVFDIETTGGNPERNGITEIFAVRYHDGEVINSFYSLVDPQIPIPPIVRRMTGINNKMLKDAPIIDDVMPKFVQYIADDFLVSHNTIGDMKFLRYFAKSTADHSLENFYLCTHLLVEKLLPKAPDKSLTGLAQHLGLATGDLHRAEADANATLKLFKVLVTELEAKGVGRIEAAIRLQGDIESGMRLGSVLTAQKELSQVTEPGIYRLIDQQGELLFQSSTSNLSRDLRKLGSYTQVPKRLLRIVLGADDIQFETSLDPLEAYLKECDLEWQQASKYDPLDWHQREVGHIILSKEAQDTYSLSLGRIEAATVHAFGPVRDRRFGRQLLDSIVNCLEAEGSGSDHRLNGVKVEVIIAAFSGELERLAADVENKLKSLWLLFNRKKRAYLAAKLDLIKKTQATKLPSLRDHLARTGFIEIDVVSVEGDESLQQKRIYPVVDGYPNDGFIITGSFEEWLGLDDNRSKLLGMMEQTRTTGRSPSSSLIHSDDSTARSDALKKKNPRRAIALAWYLSSKRRGARFLTPKALGMKLP